MMFIELLASVVFAGTTVCMLQAVMRAVMAAVAANSEILRILISSGAGRGLPASSMLWRAFPGTREGAVLCGTPAVCTDCPRHDLPVQAKGSGASGEAAPGSYTVLARHSDQQFRRDFSVRAGDVAQMELVMP